MKTPPKSAMVLAAGLGTRMCQLTDKMPKPLVKVAGRALLDHVLDRLSDAGVERAVVNVHHFGEQIIAHVKQSLRCANGYRRTRSDARRHHILGTTEEE